jgi:hypothetical protein
VEGEKAGVDGRESGRDIETINEVIDEDEDGDMNDLQHGRTQHEISRNLDFCSIPMTSVS